MTKLLFTNYGQDHNIDIYMIYIDKDMILTYSMKQAKCRNLEMPNMSKDID